MAKTICEVQFRDLDVEVQYEIDGGEVIWSFVNVALNAETLTLDEEERIAERCWEDQWV